jgi:hypothetical protein
MPIASPGQRADDGDGGQDDHCDDDVVYANHSYTSI